MPVSPCAEAQGAAETSPQPSEGEGSPVQADEAQRLEVERREQQRILEEGRRLEELEMQRREQEEERARLLQEANQRQQDELEARQAELRKQEEERREAEAQRCREEARMQQRLRSFLTKAGFSNVNEKKKSGSLFASGYKYPLHAAVKSGNAEATELLLWGGADKTLQNSAKLTPLALAQKLNKKESRADVIALLTA